MRVGVTGASGFVGGHVVAACIAAGHQPVGLVRNEQKWAETLRLHGLADVAMVHGDVTEAADVNRFVAGLDAMVHTAGIASVLGSDPAQVRAVNVGGTENVLDAAMQAGLDPIVHVSSVAALFPPPGDVMTSDDPLTTSDSVYGASKAAAEAVARALQADGAPVVIVSPGGVYGPIDAGTSDLQDANKKVIENGVFVLPKDSGGGFIDVRDLAEGIVRTLQPGQPPSRYMVGGRFISYRDWMQALERASGRKIRTLQLSPKAMVRMGRTFDQIGSKIGRFEPPISAESAYFMSYAKPTDDSAFLALLGRDYRPLDESMGDMIQWMAQEKRVTLP